MQSSSLLNLRDVRELKFEFLFLKIFSFISRGLSSTAPSVYRALRKSQTESKIDSNLVRARHIQMCDSKPSPEMTTRFVVSVEQMVPYLESLCKVDEEDENGIDVGVDSSIDNDDNEEEEEGEAEHAVAPNNETIGPQVVDEAVTYVDISMLNPIVEAWACLQKDQLNEEGTFCGR